MIYSNGLFASNYYSYPEIPKARRILETLRKMAREQRENRARKFTQSQVLDALYGMCWLNFYANRIAKLISPDCKTPVLAFTLRSDLTELHLILKSSDLGEEALVSWDADKGMGYTRTRELHYHNGFSLKHDLGKPP